MKRGFLGGTFNPPHLGHLRAAAAAAKQLGLEKLYLIPTGEPPHKQLPPDAPTAVQRLELTRLATLAVPSEGPAIPSAETLDWEIRRDGPSYTAVTAQALLREDPEGELWLLCGSDMFLSLSEWYRADWLLRSVHVAAYPRKEGEQPLLAACAERYRRDYGTEVYLVDVPPVEVSSTLLRELLAEGRGGTWIPAPVYAYILKNRLYAVRPEPEALWPLAEPWLKPSRVPHVLGCRAEAVKLARRWGADPLDAENAAILHDITKNMPLKEQLLLCEKCGIIPANFEQAYESVLHAFSGAAAAWLEFGVSPQVRDAIQWHTTGRADMSVLEKVVWLADYIEPTRQSPELESIRRLAYQDLDAAMVRAMTRSLLYMQQRGLKPYPATEAALRFIRGEETGK